MIIPDTTYGDDVGIETVVSGLVHDVRGALTLIRLMAAAARDEIELGAEERALEMLARIDATVTKSAELCQDALECGRRRAQPTRRVPELQCFDLAELTRQCALDHAHALAQARTPLVLELPARALVVSHARSVERILTNLLRNAARHGAGRPIEVSMRQAGDGVVTTVRDHGAGIPRVALAPYQRGSEGDDPCFQRFGLGLWIVRQLVRSLGGSIEVSSEPGVGTAISYCLPSHVLRLVEDSAARAHG